MFVYKDRTFCRFSKECGDVDCFRYLSDEEIKQAGKSHLPISMGEFDCYKMKGDSDEDYDT